MRPDKLIVTRTSTHKQITTTQVNVRAVVTKGFNELSDAIEIETISGLAKIKQRETALISIAFQNGEQWGGTFRDLQSTLKPKIQKGITLYTELIDKNTPFDSFELEGVRDVSEDPKLGTMFERCEDKYATMWSVYIHLAEGGCECIADCETREQAEKLYDMLNLVGKLFFREN